MCLINCSCLTFQHGESFDLSPIEFEKNYSMNQAGVEESGCALESQTQRLQ